MKRALLFIVFAPMALGAQLPVLEPGTPVRVSATTSKWAVAGTLKGVGTDSLELQEGLSLRQFHFESICRVEVRTSRSHLKGGLRGLLRAGTIAGALLAVLMLPTAPLFEGGAAGAAAAGFIYGFVFAGAAGFLIGALVGVDTWQTVFTVPLTATGEPVRPECAGPLKS